jgi:hypothetical protein
LAVPVAGAEREGGRSRRVTRRSAGPPAGRGPRHAAASGLVSAPITTLRSLAPERRAIFILLHVLGLSVEHCAVICNTTPNAVRVADGRGRPELDNYLGARCEHLDPGNACHCIARLGNALEQASSRGPATTGTTTCPSFPRSTATRASSTRANPGYAFRVMR